MRDGGGGSFFSESETIPRSKFGDEGQDYDSSRISSVSAFNNPAIYDRMSCEGSPMMMSPWNQTTPFTKTNWSQQLDETPAQQYGLIGSIVREEGHIYSLAATKDLLYTGSDSKNIRVWKNLKEFTGFKSSSGLVKAIVISGEKVFTGHQDGKIRVWKISPKNQGVHKRAGTLPTLKDIFKSSIRPSNYVEVRRHRTALWIKHSDAVSCLSLNKEQGLLYSASWDRTVKVWQISNSKCLESINAHDDAVNAVVCSQDYVFTGSADGTVKMWKRENLRKNTKHVLIQTLLEQESAITSLAVSDSGSVYCGSSDGLVNYWERDKSNLNHGGVLKGHKLAVLCLQAAGNLVFSGSADKAICVWRRDRNNNSNNNNNFVHTCLTVLSGHTGPVKCLAVEADRDVSAHGEQRWTVYSGSLDKSVKVWRVSEYPPDLNQTAIGQQQSAISYPDSFPSDDSFNSSGGVKNQKMY